MFIFRDIKTAELRRKIKAYIELAGEEPKLRIAAGSWMDNGDPCVVGARVLHAELTRDGMLRVGIGGGQVSFVRAEDIDGLIITLGSP